MSRIEHMVLGHRRTALAFTVTVFTSFTKITFVWSSALAWVLRPLHLHSRPLFKTIRNSLCIWIIQLWFAELIAKLAALMVYSCIVLCSSIHAYGNGYQLAWPSTGWTTTIVTCKSAHDVSVVLLLAIAVVISVEIEEEIVLFKQIRHRIMVWRVHRPRLRWHLRGVCPFARHSENWLKLAAWERVSRVCWFRLGLGKSR